MSNTIEMRFSLVNAVTEYDRKQSTRKHYNRYALAQYLAAVEDVTNAVNCGSTRRDALVSKLNGRLLDVCLKALNMDRSTREEQLGSL
ncbi:MAG: hypothetical protein WBP52_08725 [Terriglobales bacterium]|jgi:hypothetical protein